MSDSLRGVTILDWPGRRRSKIGLDVRLGEFQARRAAVHNHTHAAAVGFAPRRDAEQLSEAACHAGMMRKKPRVVKSINSIRDGDEFH